MRHLLIILLLTCCVERTKRPKSYYATDVYNVEVRYFDNSYDTIQVRVSKRYGPNYIKMNVYTPDGGTRTSTLMSYVDSPCCLTFPEWATDIKTFKILY